MRIYRQRTEKLRCGLRQPSVTQRCSQIVRHRVFWSCRRAVLWAANAAGSTILNLGLGVALKRSGGAYRTFPLRNTDLVAHSSITALCDCRREWAQDWAVGERTTFFHR